MDILGREAWITRFHMVQETLMFLSIETIRKDLIWERNKYSEGLVQKANLQLLAIRSICEDREWRSALQGRTYSYLVDPLSVSALLRGVYECMLTLNHVFVNPPNQDEVELRYLLWELSTFISKDKGTPTQFEENKIKRAQNRKYIEHVVDYLTNLEIVQSLSEPSQRLIKEKVSANAGDGWEYYIDELELKRVKTGWHGLAERVPARKGVFENLYKLFSINSHPTWHSIHVVVNAFDLEEGEPENFRMMDTMLSMAAMLGAFIIYDYCSLFPEVKVAFAKLPSGVKEIMNLLLVTFKGDNYAL